LPHVSMTIDQAFRVGPSAPVRFNSILQPSRMRSLRSDETRKRLTAVTCEFETKGCLELATATNVPLWFIAAFEDGKTTPGFLAGYEVDLRATFEYAGVE
jgi:hypothetical protein